MANVSVESLGARVRHVRREAELRGMVVRKAHNDLNLHRYIILQRENAHMIRRSHNFEFPYSFSLEEAEAYLERRF